MSDLKIIPMTGLGYGFVPPRYLPAGADENYLRDCQSSPPPGGWRRLRTDEIETLVKNGNTCDNWDHILVADRFNPQHVKNCEFYGLVRIGRLEDVSLEHHELTVPAGLTNSRIISCDIGDDAAVHHVRYLAHTIVGANAVLLNIDEMHTTNHAKFGNGIVTEGEDESTRIWMDVINEAGGRSILPFDGMTAGDAYLWATGRDDAAFSMALKEMTQRQFDSRRGFYGRVGDRSVVKNCGIIKDVRIGPCAYVKGANKLKNLTINSSEAQPTQVGEGVELVNGIISPGCRVFYGCKAVRFVMGENSALKYGARLIHSYLGANSTVSCCEMLNNLIFPAHEQHHNNSFLIASLVKGQSNIAACATIGSNHNSRRPDGELHAGRGFWPGLCVSVKHNCRFASFVLLAKGDYPAELAVPLPFALVSNDAARDRLVVMPAYWWMYNMYALARNAWKFPARDKRPPERRRTEYDYLAPDTAEEMLAARGLIEEWTAKAWLRAEGRSFSSRSGAWLRRIGRALLSGPAEKLEGVEVFAEGVENSPRPVEVLKSRRGWRAYGRMLRFYAVRNLLDYLDDKPGATLASMKRALAGKCSRRWGNLGGQLVPDGEVARIRRDVKSGRLDSWDKVHRRYDELWDRYRRDRQRHAMGVLRQMLTGGKLTGEAWGELLDEARKTANHIAEQAYVTRKKDFDNPFRRMVYGSDAEMTAVLGSAEDDSFVKQVRDDARRFARRVRRAKKRV